MKMLPPSCFVIAMAMTVRVTLAVDVPPRYSSVKAWTLSKNPHKFEIVKDYVHYNLYFNENSNQQTCVPGDSDHVNNATTSLFAEAIDMSPMLHYYPRVLSSTQVSFKRNDQKHSNNPPGNSSQEMPLNQSSTVPDTDLSAAANITAFNTSLDNMNVDNDKNDIIHEYLAIALVLPNHPFSRALVDSMRIVAPMYPSVTVYFGIATEFESLCNQYGVRSYPKLLLFHKGLLVDKHANVKGEKYKPAKLAKRFSRWTNRLPRTDPVNLPHVRSKKKTALRDQEQGMSTTLALQNITALAQVVQEWCGHAVMSQLFSELPHNTTNRATELTNSHLNFGESIEPIVSFSEDAKAWDIPLYLLSSLYVGMRLLYFMYNFLFGSTSTANSNSIYRY